MKVWRKICKNSSSSKKVSKNKIIGPLKKKPKHPGTSSKSPTDPQLRAHFSLSLSPLTYSDQSHLKNLNCALPLPVYRVIDKLEFFCCSGEFTQFIADFANEHNGKFALTEEEQAIECYQIWMEFKAQIDSRLEMFIQS